MISVFWPLLVGPLLIGLGLAIIEAMFDAFIAVVNSISSAFESH